MKMKHTVCLTGFAVAAFAWASAFAQQPRLEIKGVPLGLAPDAYSPRPFFKPLQCAGDHCRMPPDSIMGFGPAVVENADVELIDGKVESITMRITEAAFEPLVAAITEKYGKPTQDVDIPVQNRLGATFHDRRVTWKLVDGTIFVSQRNGDVGHGAVSLFSNKSTAAFAARQADKPKRDAKGL